MRPYRTALFDNSRWAEFVPRPDDVFVCSPAKCGTTWTQTIIANLFWPDGNLPGPVMQISPGSKRCSCRPRPCTPCSAPRTSGA